MKKEDIKRANEIVDKIERLEDMVQKLSVIGEVKSVSIQGFVKKFKETTTHKMQSNSPLDLSLQLNNEKYNNAVDVFIGSLIGLYKGEIQTLTADLEEIN